jgi:hypothetical protein
MVKEEPNKPNNLTHIFSLGVGKSAPMNNSGLII